MPKSFPPFGCYDDPDTIRSFEWMVSFIDDLDWRSRIEEIETRLEENLPSQTKYEATSVLGPITPSNDRAAWYLYLVDTALHAPHKYHPTEGARIVPIFKRLGTDLELLKSIPGADDRVKRMLTSEKNQPDAILFELLVSLIWRRNGAKKIEFVKETLSNRSPDIRASKGKNIWNIECKRLEKKGEYSDKETKRWQQMWSCLSDVLIGKRYSFVFSVVFHVELDTLPDDFLKTELLGKLPLIQMSGTIISNEIWDVSVAPIDYASANEHLSRYLVKYPSDQIIELVGGRREPNHGFSATIEGGFVRMGGGPGSNHFLDKLFFATGAFWICDAPASVERKARDIRKHLAKAVEQLPEDRPGVVHIGLETVDGQLVEEERFRRITCSVQKFDSRDKDLRWIYCHLFQAYAPPYAEWIFDETVYFFGRQGKKTLEPIVDRSAIVPKEEFSDGKSGDSFHWRRTPP